MLRFSANISTLFSEIPMLDRFAAAGVAGFRAIEAQAPYSWDADDLKRARDKAGVEFVLLSFPSGDRSKGECGIAALPERVDELAKGIEVTRRYAERLGVKRLNLLCGRVDSGVEKGRARETLIMNFRRAARAVRDLGAIVMLEAINTHDFPGFYISRQDDALALIDEVGEPNVGLQFDIYHVARMGDPIVSTFERLLPRIGHVQFSDFPGHQEPGTGTIDFDSVFTAIDRSAYSGWTGAEYYPRRPTTETLAWLASYGRSK